jgi:putative iron-dependent peroxidase
LAASIEVEEIHGFRWIEERDLSGFVDGTKTRPVLRPAVKWRSSKMAWMPAAATCSFSAGSITSSSLNRMSVPDQEMMIGRTKEANEEIDGDDRRQPRT